MSQLTSSSLFQAFTSLSEVSEQLSMQLTQTAKKLQEKGEIPGEQIVEALETLRRQFFALREQGVMVAQSLAITPPSPMATLTSLHDIRTLLQEISRAEEQRAVSDDILQRALAVLDRVLLIQHCEQPAFPPLLECQARAREMREAVAATQWPNLHPATESLASGEDPFSDLLSWLDQQNSLEDDEWALLQDTVEQFFGKALAIAVSRGRLIVPPQPSQPQTLLQRPAVFPAEEPQSFPVIEIQQPDDLGIPPDLALGSEEQPMVVGLESLTTETHDAHPIIEEIVAPESTENNEDLQALELNLSQTLPDTISLTTPYGFGPEDSAQHIAATIAQSQENVQRPISLRDLTWRLLGEDKVSLAFHLTSYLDTQHPELQPRIPSWLLRAIMLGRHVRHAKGETARFLEADFTRFSPQLYFSGQSEWNQAITFLLAAAALQPALLAPQTRAPAVLQALRWEANLPQFSTYCRSVANYGAHQHPLDPNLLKKGKEQTAWQTETDVLKQAVELWWVRSSRLPLTYTPAAKVWQKWLEPKGMIAALLSPIRHNDASKLIAVKRAVELFADNTQFKREVDHTDHELLGRRLGEDINSRALEQLRLYTREAIGFARRWLELQEVHMGQRHGSAHEQAEQLRQTILELQGPVQEELSLFKRRHPSPLLLSSVACCRRTIDNLQQLFDSEAPFPTEEPLPRPLLYADLLRIPTVSLNEQWEVEGSDWEALAQGVLELVANGALKKAAA